MVDDAPRLASLLQRPPTPPKESTAKQEDNGIPDNIANRGLLDTPEDSPSSSAECFNSSSGKIRKKVNFSGWTRFHKPLSIGSKGCESDDLRPLARSRDNKSVKSILKPSIDNVTTGVDGDLALDNSDVPAMLRSTSIHLASHSRSARLDAYSTLLACLSAYDNVPEAQELVERVSEITGQIRRDISTKREDDEIFDTQLVTQALKLLTVLLCSPSTANSLEEDFCSFIVEQAVMSIEDEKSSKILVSHYMHLLERQKFGPKIMTVDRANRVITAVDGVTNRIKGNRVVGQRLMIYQRLLTQAKPVMASRTTSWMDHLISGMMSTIKDTRTRAIAFGVEAGLRLGSTGSVSQTCIDIFNRKSPEGRKVVEFVSDRLIEMSNSKEDGPHVPQIWAVAILFLRSRRRQLECWEHLKAWLGIIQRCFNSSEPPTKFQANVAWDRLIFAVNLDISTSESMTRMLRQAIMSQLERKTIETKANYNFRQAKQIARSSYCLLLYYAFRPSASHAQLNHFWELYVADMIPKCFVGSKAEIDHACDILTALLSNNGQPKMWDENRANRLAAVKPDDLPCLDPKWIRSKISSIMAVYDKLLTVAEWQPERGREAPIVLTWRSMMLALANASSKEVKVSTELMNAVAQVVNQIKSMLGQGNNEASTILTYQKADILLEEAVSKIGVIPFMERRLSLTTNNTFEAASETPSNRVRVQIGTLNSPAKHLLNLLLSMQSNHDSPAYVNLVRSAMRIGFQLNSRRSQIDVLRNLARLLPSGHTDFPLEAKSVLWRLLVDSTSLALGLPSTSDTCDGSPQYPGHEYREAVKIIESGLQLRSPSAPSIWRKLYDSITETIGQEIGLGGVILLVTEPIAGFICKELAMQCDNDYVDVVIALLQHVRWPQSMQMMERAQMQLWGVVKGHHKLVSLDPFENVYTLMDESLDKAYQSLDSLFPETVTALISAVTTVMTSCPPAMQAGLLAQLQGGLSVWIEDSKGAVASPRNDTYVKVKKLWALVITFIESVPDSSSQFLASIQTLVASSLRSRHKSILNDAISMWNHTFGCADTLEYPENLRKPLKKLKASVDIELPGFVEDEGDELSSSPFSFVSTQDNEDLLAEQSEPILERQPSPEMQISVLGTPLKSLAFARSPNVARDLRSPAQSARQAVKTTPKARPRHKDSQIQFAAIESSPIAFEGVDSQTLTERQREVKERQGREALMFPEINSSPKSASKLPLPWLALKQTQDARARLNVDEDPSPTFPPDSRMNRFLGSSPTPHSSRKKPQDHEPDSGPPSSPSFVSSRTQITRKNAPILTEKPQPRIPERPLRESRSGSSSRKHSLRAEIPNANYADQSDPKAQGFLSDANLMSDMEVFVDAPSEVHESHTAEETVQGPTFHSNVEIFSAQREDHSTPFEPEQEAVLAAGERHVLEASRDEVSQVISSFQSHTSSHFSTEEEEVTAQLVAEMARAESQQTMEAQHGCPSGNKVSRKRKRSSVNPPRKKSKAPLASSDSPAIEVADYVLIDARQATRANQNLDSDVVIKSERTLTPSLASAQAVEEMPAVSEQPVRHKRRSTTDHLPSQESSSAQQNQEPSQVKAEQEEERPGGLMSFPKKGNWKHTPRPAGLRRSTRRSDTNEAPKRDDRESVDQRHEKPMDHQAGRLRPETPRPAPAPNAASEGPANPTSAQSILAGLQGLLNSIRHVALNPEEERAVSRLLFESVHQVHEAGRRYTGI